MVTSRWIRHQVCRLLKTASERLDELVPVEARQVAHIHGDRCEAHGLASAWAERDERARALALVEELEALAAARYLRPSIVARARLSMEDIDTAFRWLDRAVEARDTALVVAPLWPGYDALRTDARYQRLVDRVRLWPPGSG